MCVNKGAYRTASTHIHHFGRHPLRPGGRKHLDETSDGHEDLDQEDHWLATKLVGGPGAGEENKNIADRIGSWSEPRSLFRRAS